MTEKSLQAQEPNQFLQIIQSAITKDGINPDIIDKLLDAKHRHEAEEARRAYHVAMTKFRANAPTIEKDITPDPRAKIGKYAGLPGTLQAVQPLESELGLSHRWETHNEGDLIRVTCIVSHEQGHSESTTLTAGSDTSGAKNSVQAIGSTVSYLQRYTFMSAFGLASAEMDDDGYAAGKVPESDLIDASTQADIEALADEILKTPEQRVAFAGWLKTKAGAANGFIRNIPQRNVESVVKALESKRGAA